MPNHCMNFFYFFNVLKRFVNCLSLIQENLILFFTFLCDYDCGEPLYQLIMHIPLYHEPNNSFSSSSIQQPFSGPLSG